MNNTNNVHNKKIGNSYYSENINNLTNDNDACFANIVFVSGIFLGRHSVLVYNKVRYAVSTPVLRSPPPRKRAKTQ